MPRSVTTQVGSLSLRTCPQCGNTYLSNAFYRRSDGRLEYCHGPGTAGCHRRYWAGRAAKRRVELGQRFGLELEFIGSREGLAARLKRDVGLRVRVEDYNHVTRRSWKITTDGSLRPPDGWDAGELVSPPLKFSRDTLKRIDHITHSAAQVARVNSSCGLHVHCEVVGYSRADVLAVARSWLNVQGLVKELVPPARRTNRYACDLNLATIRHLEARGLEFHEVNRYQNLNLCSFPQYGTIEFRLHHGTLDGEEITSWVGFCQAFVRAGKLKVIDATSLVDLIGLLTQHGLETDAAQKLLKRASSWEAATKGSASEVAQAVAAADRIEAETLASISPPRPVFRPGGLVQHPLPLPGFTITRYEPVLGDAFIAECDAFIAECDAAMLRNAVRLADNDSSSLA